MRSIHWFRKGLRLHDNPALVEACRSCEHVYPVFILDPWFAKPDTVGIHRYEFLLQCLRDVDSGLRELGSRLYVVQGSPEEQLPRLFKEWNVQRLTYEFDSEPYAQIRDRKVCNIAKQQGLNVIIEHSHTLRNLESYIGANRGTLPLSYGSFEKLFSKMGRVREDIPAPSHIPSHPSEVAGLTDAKYNVPNHQDMGYEYSQDNPECKLYPGGESEALRRLQETVVRRPEWSASFEKPKVSFLVMLFSKNHSLLLLFIQPISHE